MLLAEGAVLLQLDTVRSVLLVLHVVVIALLALSAGKANLVTNGICHLGHLLPYPVCAAGERGPSG
jgi:hypothetical protein